MNSKYKSDDLCTIWKCCIKKLEECLVCDKNAEIVQIVSVINIGQLIITK